MITLADDLLEVFRYPLLLFLVSFVTLWLSAWFGATRLKGLRAQAAVLRDDFGVIQGATLTLLGLIIGFTFSMALGRYERTTRRRRRTQSAPNSSGPISCRLPTPRRFGVCS
jgi:hypothetical protein